MNLQELIPLDKPVRISELRISPAGSFATVHGFDLTGHESLMIGASIKLASDSDESAVAAALRETGPDGAFPLFFVEPRKDAPDSWSAVRACCPWCSDYVDAKAEHRTALHRDGSLNVYCYPGCYNDAKAQPLKGEVFPEEVADGR